MVYLQSINFKFIEVKYSFITDNIRYEYYFYISKRKKLFNHPG